MVNFYAREEVDCGRFYGKYKQQTNYTMLLQFYLLQSLQLAAYMAITKTDDGQYKSSFARMPLAATVNCQLGLEHDQLPRFRVFIYCILSNI